MKWHSVRNLRRDAMGASFSEKMDIVVCLAGYGRGRGRG